MGRKNTTQPISLLPPMINGEFKFLYKYVDSNVNYHHYNVIKNHLQNHDIKKIIISTPYINGRNKFIESSGDVSFDNICDFFKIPPSSKSELKNKEIIILDSGHNFKTFIKYVTSEKFYSTAYTAWTSSISNYPMLKYAIPIAPKFYHFTHSKLYLFEYENESFLIITSANFSQNGLKDKNVDQKVKNGNYEFGIEIKLKEKIEDFVKINIESDDVIQINKNVIEFIEYMNKPETSNKNIDEFKDKARHFFESKIHAKDDRNLKIIRREINKLKNLK